MRCWVKSSGESRAGQGRFSRKSVAGSEFEFWFWQYCFFFRGAPPPHGIVLDATPAYFGLQRPNMGSCLILVGSLEDGDDAVHLLAPGEETSRCSVLTSNLKARCSLKARATVYMIYICISTYVRGCFECTFSVPAENWTEEWRERTTVGCVSLVY